MKTLNKIAQTVFTVTALTLATTVVSLTTNGQKTQDFLRFSKLAFNHKIEIILSEFPDMYRFQNSVLWRITRSCLPVWMESEYRSPHAILPDCKVRIIPYDENSVTRNFLHSNPLAEDQGRINNFYSVEGTVESSAVKSSLFVTTLRLSDATESPVEEAVPVEEWMISRAGWTENEAEPAVTLESWMLSNADWTVSDAESEQPVESWMLNTSGWIDNSVEANLPVESWMLSDAGWGSENQERETDQPLESWMLSTESWGSSNPVSMK